MANNNRSIFPSSDTNNQLTPDFSTLSDQLDNGMASPIENLGNVTNDAASSLNSFGKTTEITSKRLKQLDAAMEASAKANHTSSVNRSREEFLNQNANYRTNEVRRVEPVRRVEGITGRAEFTDALNMATNKNQYTSVKSSTRPVLLGETGKALGDDLNKNLMQFGHMLSPASFMTYAMMFGASFPVQMKVAETLTSPVTQVAGTYNVGKEFGKGVMGIGDAISGFTHELKQSPFQKYEGLYQSKIMLSSALGGEKASNDAINTALKMAREYPVKTEQVLSSLTRLAVYPEVKPYLKDQDFQKKLMETVSGLSLIVPEQGMEGAMFSLVEALSGSWRSLQMRFNVSPEVVQSLSGMSKGEMSSDPTKLIGGLHKFIAGSVGLDVLEKQKYTFSKQIDNFGDSLQILTKNIFETTGLYRSITGGATAFQSGFSALAGNKDFLNFVGEITLPFQNSFDQAMADFAGVSLGTYKSAPMGDVTQMIEDNFSRLSPEEIGNRFNVMIDGVSGSLRKTSIVIDNLLNKQFGTTLKDIGGDIANAMANDFAGMTINVAGAVAGAAISNPIDTMKPIMIMGGLITGALLPIQMLMGTAQQFFQNKPISQIVTNSFKKMSGLNKTREYAAEMVNTGKAKATTGMIFGQRGNESTSGRLTTKEAIDAFEKQTKILKEVQESTSNNIVREFKTPLKFKEGSANRLFASRALGGATGEDLFDGSKASNKKLISLSSVEDQRLLKKAGLSTEAQAAIAKGNANAIMEKMRVDNNIMNGSPEMRPSDFRRFKKLFSQQEVSYAGEISKKDRSTIKKFFGEDVNSLKERYIGSPLEKRLSTGLLQKIKSPSGRSVYADEAMSKGSRTAIAEFLKQQKDSGMSPEFKKVLKAAGISSDDISKGNITTSQAKQFISLQQDIRRATFEVAKATKERRYTVTSGASDYAQQKMSGLDFEKLSRQVNDEKLFRAAVKTMGLEGSGISPHGAAYQAGTYAKYADKLGSVAIDVDTGALDSKGNKILKKIKIGDIYNNADYMQYATGEISRGELLAKYATDTKTMMPNIQKFKLAEAGAGQLLKPGTVGYSEVMKNLSLLDRVKYAAVAKLPTTKVGGDLAEAVSQGGKGIRKYIGGRLVGAAGTAAGGYAGYKFAEEMGFDKTGRLITTGVGAGLMGGGLYKYARSFIGKGAMGKTVGLLAGGELAMPALTLMGLLTEGHASYRKRGETAMEYQQKISASGLTGQALSSAKTINLRGEESDRIGQGLNEIKKHLIKNTAIAVGTGLIGLAGAAFTGGSSLALTGTAIAMGVSGGAGAAGSDYFKGKTRLSAPEKMASSAIVSYGAQANNFQRKNEIIGKELGIYKERISRGDTLSTNERTSMSMLEKSYKDNEFMSKVANISAKTVGDIYTQDTGSNKMTDKIGSYLKNQSPDNLSKAEKIGQYTAITQMEIAAKSEIQTVFEGENLDKKRQVASQQADTSEMLGTKFMEAVSSLNPKTDTAAFERLRQAESARISSIVIDTKDKEVTNMQRNQEGKTLIGQNIQANVISSISQEKPIRDLFSTIEQATGGKLNTLGIESPLSALTNKDFSKDFVNRNLLSFYDKNGAGTEKQRQGWAKQRAESASKSTFKNILEGVADAFSSNGKISSTLAKNRESLDIQKGTFSKMKGGFTDAKQAEITTLFSRREAAMSTIQNLNKDGQVVKLVNDVLKSEGSNTTISNVQGLQNLSDADIKKLQGNEAFKTTIVGLNSAMTEMSKTTIQLNTVYGKTSQIVEKELGQSIEKVSDAAKAVGYGVSTPANYTNESVAQTDAIKNSIHALVTTGNNKQTNAQTELDKATGEFSNKLAGDFYGAGAPTVAELAQVNAQTGKTKLQDMIDTGMFTGSPEALTQVQKAVANLQEGASEKTKAGVIGFDAAAQLGKAQLAMLPSGSPFMDTAIKFSSTNYEQKQKLKGIIGANFKTSAENFVNAQSPEEANQWQVIMKAQQQRLTQLGYNDRTVQNILGVDLNKEVGNKAAELFPDQTLKEMNTGGLSAAQIANDGQSGANTPTAPSTPPTSEKGGEPVRPDTTTANTSAPTQIGNNTPISPNVNNCCDKPVSLDTDTVQDIAPTKELELGQDTVKEINAPPDVNQQLVKDTAAALSVDNAPSGPDVQSWADDHAATMEQVFGPASKNDINNVAPKEEPSNTQKVDYSQLLDEGTAINNTNISDALKPEVIPEQSNFLLSA